MILIKALVDFSTAIHANASQLPQLEMRSLTTLHQELTKCNGNHSTERCLQTHGSREIKRRLDVTRQYAATIPHLRYLLPLMPTHPHAALATPGDTDRPPLPHQSANSTTGLDRQPLRYAKLIKGNGSAAWIEAHTKEFDRLLSTTKTMHFILPEDKPPDRLQPAMFNQK